MNTEMKPAVIGVGLSGGRYVNALAELGYQVILFDIDSNRSKVKRDELESSGRSVFIADSLENAVRDADCVFVCTPDHLHKAPVAVVAQAGKPLFLEKPIAPTFDEASQIAEMAKEKNIPTVIGLMYRLTPVFQEARKVFGKTGDKIVNVQCDYRRGDMAAAIASQPWRYNQHLLRGDGIHAVDLAQYIMAEAIVSASGKIDDQAGSDPIPGYKLPTRYQCGLAFPSASATIYLDATAGMQDIWPPNADKIVNGCYLKIQGKKYTVIAHNKTPGIVVVENSSGQSEYRSVDQGIRPTVPMSAEKVMEYFSGKTNAPSPLPSLHDALQVTAALQLADQSALGDNQPLPLSNLIFKRGLS